MQTGDRLQDVNPLFIDRRIRINVICPGNTKTGLTDDFNRSTSRTGDPEEGKKIIEQIFLARWNGRWASAEEMGWPMVALGSQLGSYISGQVIYIDYGITSAWLTDSVLTLDNNKNIILDLNGYPMIRTIKKASKNGELIMVGTGTTLNIIDSRPDSRTCSAFNGGSIQGGRSSNTGGLIDVHGSFGMTGGALYNGGTTEDGGAIRVMGGAVSLKNTLIANCWANKAKVVDNNGGAIAIMNKASVSLQDCTIRACLANEMGGGIYMKNKESTLKLTNVDILGCKANDEEGGAIHQDSGNVSWIGGSAVGCSAPSDDGGAIWQNNGELYCENIKFIDNKCEDLGGAVMINTDDPTWFVNCEFTRNVADDDGGAIYLDKNHLYMDGCTVTNNASKDKGGGLYLESSGSIDVCGKMTIKDNDGAGSMDNLVMEKAPGCTIRAWRTDHVSTCAAPATEKLHSPLRAIRPASIR